MPDILIKYPTRSRPALFRETIECWRNGRVRFLVSMHDDDPVMNCDEIRQFLSLRPDVRYVYTEAQNKVENINAGLDGEQFDILIQIADDQRPTVPDWDLRIAALFQEHFPDFDGVLHINDGRQGERLCTLPVLGRKYYERFGYIYHPSYKSLWCDNELTDVARELNRLLYVPEVLVRHHWIELTGKDALHVWGESFWNEDEANYRNRKAAGFPISANALERQSVQMKNVVLS